MRLSNMKVEHEIERQSARKVAARILSIRIEPDNYAIVLNVSDEGLGFHAHNPVTQSGMVHFSFSDNGQRFEGMGELIWTDATQKSGGLRFSSLSRASRQRIWNWLDELGAIGNPGPPARPITQHEGTALPILAPREESVASVARSSEVIVAAGSAKLPEPASTQTTERPFLGMALPQHDAALPAEAVTPAAHVPQPTMYPGFSLIKEDPPYSWNQQIEPPKFGTKFISGFVTGGIVSGILVAILIFAYGNPSSLLLMTEQTRTSTPTASQREPAPPPPSGAFTHVPSPPASSGSVGLPGILSSDAGAMGNSSAAGVTDATNQTAPTKQAIETERPAISKSRLHLKPARINRSPKPVADFGDEDLALAQRYLNDKTGRADGAIAAPFLWAAIEKGNVAAEVTLGHLYARGGDGFAKNCDQARVLFRAAAEKGSSEASQELSQIIRRGCR
jgi:hypothetical protein